MERDIVKISKFFKNLFVLGTLLSIISISYAIEIEVERPSPESHRMPPRQDIEIPDDLQTLIDSYKAEQDVLRQELRADIDALEEPTNEEIQAVRDEFKTENSDRIDAQKDLRTDIKDGFTELREDNTGDNPAIPVEIQTARDEFKAARRSLRDERKALHDALKDATAEEREALKEEFLADHQEEIDALKALKKDLRDKARNAANLTGTERTDDGN